MSREIDRRDFSANKATAARKAELRSLASEASGHLPEAHRIRIESFDATTGNPRVIASESAPAETSNYVQRALNHVQTIGRALGLEASQPTEFVPDPKIQQTSSRAVAVHLQQQYKGIPVFQAQKTVRFAPDGTLTETAGSSVTVDEEVDILPRLSVQEAVLKAARYVAVPQPDEEGATDQFGEPLNLTRVDLTGFEPRIIATFPDKAERTTVLEAGPFGDRIRAGLIWFPLDNDLRLAWEVLITMPNQEGQYRTLTDTETGEILYCRQLMDFVTARANVYHVDGRGERKMTNFPRPLTDYGVPLPPDLPPGFPDHWTAMDRTVGNSVNAHLGISGPPASGALKDGVLTFDPVDPAGDEQKVLNIFYYSCYMHDFFYLLGFREAEGNFQNENFGRGGISTDRVDARAHSGPVQGTANMATPVDGSSPVMNMGLVSSTNRHTAFDSTVVFHEFMHGVTNRLVGGPLNSQALEAAQSGGMGEGWGDYVACTINDTTVVGSWVVNRAGGIRAFPYDVNFPDDFGDVGKGRYTEVHNIGEIWCATLLELNRQMGKALGVQLVVDALKLSPANPSFLDMRDSILAALDNKLTAGQLSSGEHSAARDGFWEAFAKFGMGPGASSNGASLSGIVADYMKPAEDEERVQVEAAPNLAIPDNQSVGVSSTIAVSRAGKISRLTVSTEIEHPYIGDLRVSLAAPGADTVVLHDRAGASADNLIKAYTSEDNPILATLVGRQSQGDWTLKVADLARRDLGTLRRWSLEIELEAAPRVTRMEAAPALKIPDDDPSGVSSTIAISQSGTVQGVEVGVDLTHTYVGDLLVELMAPTGQRAVLHDRLGGSSDNLITTYDSVSTPSLEALIGQPIQGSWVMRVTDLAGQDVGKLNRWSIELIYGD